jgi:hypothetical protein
MELVGPFWRLLKKTNKERTSKTVDQDHWLTQKIISTIY